MSELIPTHVPSKAQVVNAIYETIVSPHLFDRFLHENDPLHQYDGRSQASGLKSARVAREMSCHFSRAIDLLRDQWEKKNYQEPAYLHEEGGGTWVVVSCQGQALRCSRVARQILDFLPSDVLKAFGVDDASAQCSWDAFLSRVASDEFLWRDFLVLKTAKPGLCLLCRPVVGGGIAGERAAIMVETLEVRSFPGAISYLRRGLGLNGQEAAVLGAVLRGRPLKAIPEQILDQAVARAGAPGAAELLRLAAYLLAEHASDLAIASGDRLPPSCRISTPDGRRLQYLRLGAETGQPVIFMHGLLDCLAGVMRLQPQLRQLGFRVYVPLRNGYGESGPVPRRQRHLEVFGDQLEMMMAQEGLQRPILLAHRGGMVFALAAALRWRDRIAGIVAVSPLGPLRTIRDITTLRGYQRAFALCSSFARPLLPIVMRSWSRSVRKAGVEVLLSRQSTPGCSDRQRVANMNLAPLLRHSHDFAMRQGGAGFIADVDLVLRDWRQVVRGRPSAGRLLYLYGSRESGVQAGGWNGASCGAQHVQYRQCEGADGTLFYTRPELILSALEELSQGEQPISPQAQPFSVIASNT